VHPFTFEIEGAKAWTPAKELLARSREILADDEVKNFIVLIIVNVCARLYVAFRATMAALRHRIGRRMQ